MNNAESLAKASKELMLKEPFYGLLLMSLNKVWDPGFNVRGNATMGVRMRGINYELVINPSFWESLTPVRQMGVLKHELQHIGFFHLTDYHHLKDQEMLNVAMDVEINQYIDRNWLPEDGCFLERFPELKNQEKMGTRYYYDKLKEAKDKDKNNSGAGAVQVAIDNGDGSCTLPDGTTIKIPEHTQENAQLDEATQKMIKAQTGHILKQVADQVQKSRGTIPGEFEEILKRLNTVEPPKFDWKGYIRRFAGKSVKTYTKKSRRKFNIRMPDNPGLKIRRQKHILVGIDTSGSVSQEELKEFLGEMYHLQKTGSDVTVVQCDTAISSIKRFNHREDFKVTGRGGTDFQPVIDFYNEHQLKYSCLMYFTDGEAPAPENARGNILWVLSSKSDMNDKLPGHVIKLDI